MVKTTIKDTDCPIDGIWCVFSVDNAYDQPDHNLVGFWHEKPDLLFLAVFMGCDFATVTDSDRILQIVNLWKGEDVRINEVHYRLRPVAPNIQLLKQKATLP